MKKALLLLCFFVAIVMATYSQTQDGIVRYMKFQINFSASDEPIGQKWIYIMNNDSIVAKSMTFKDGIAFVKLKEDSDVDATYLTIRHNDNSVMRIRLSCFQDRDTVSSPTIRVVMLENKCQYVDDIEIAMMQNSIYDVKNMYHTAVDISEHNSLSRRPYFPLERLMYSYEVYKQSIEDSIWLNNYKFVTGFYPNAKEIDSLIGVFQMEDSYIFESWCSSNIAQLNEPVISESNTQNVYRFSWFVSNHCHRLYEPYCFRIVPSENGADVYFSYRYWDMCEEYPLYCDMFPMTQEIYKEFLGLLQKMKYWGSPTLTDKFYFDMAYTNVMEANIDGKYHVLFRDDGEEEGMDELREFLWGLTGLGENKIVHRRQRIE